MTPTEFFKRVKKKLKRLLYGEPQTSYITLTADQEETSCKVCAQLFDADWYQQQNPDVSVSDLPPLVHFVRYGYIERRKPHPLFDCAWYFWQYPDVAAAAINPLQHYLTTGAKQGCNPNPIFDSAWYRRHNPDAERAGLNPLVHYVETGWKACRDPSPNFSIIRYLDRHPHVAEASVEPLSHYLQHGFSKDSAANPYGPPTSLESNAVAMMRQMTYFTNPGPGFEPVDSGIIGGESELAAKVIAFYLPQFHTTAENDAWWGTGFTEWRNVTKAQSRFLGHYQPRLPRDLGFYDLRTPGVMAKQVELAKNAGLHGFCFYYYFFDGKKLLDEPVATFAADRSVDFPFCLLWANESWSRMWDGAPETVLMRQRHDPSFEEALIDDLAAYFKHANYICVQGRPIFFIYRADQLESSGASVSRWRKGFQQRHGLNPYFVMCQTFDSLDPRRFGFDGALEFPPHKLGRNQPLINSMVPSLDPDFAGELYRYSDLVDRSLTQPVPQYDLIRTVMPSWDNEARRTNSARLWHGSTPSIYEQWLGKIIKQSLEHPFNGESIVCINAWNEWAEGAYLEPDLHWGAAYLNATARAIASAATRGAGHRSDSGELLSSR